MIPVPGDDKRIGLGDPVETEIPSPGHLPSVLGVASAQERSGSSADDTGNPVRRRVLQRLLFAGRLLLAAAGRPPRTFPCSWRNTPGFRLRRQRHVLALPCRSPASSRRLLHAVRRRRARHGGISAAPARSPNAEAGLASWQMVRLDPRNGARRLAASIAGAADARTGGRYV